MSSSRCVGAMSSGGNRRINTSTECEIIEGVTVDVKARVVTVKGKRGSLTRDFKHLNVEIYKSKNAKTGKDVIMVSLSLCLRAGAFVLATGCDQSSGSAREQRRVGVVGWREGLVSGEGRWWCGVRQMRMGGKAGSGPRTPYHKSVREGYRLLANGGQVPP